MQRGVLQRNTNFVNLWGAATVSTFWVARYRHRPPLHRDPSARRISSRHRGATHRRSAAGLCLRPCRQRLGRSPLPQANHDRDRPRSRGAGRGIPLAAFLAWLGLGQLYVIAALVSVLSVFFDVSYQSFLPSLVENDELVEANSKLSAAMSVAEASAFSSAGWLIQLLTAPVVMLVDALTFIASAGLVARIREPERQAEPSPAESRPSIASDVMEGLRAVWWQPILRGMVVAGLAQNLAFGLVGTVVLLYVNQEVGFDPGILGMIFAVGGVSSFLGAMIAGRLPRFGIGAVMVARSCSRRSVRHSSRWQPRRTRSGCCSSSASRSWPTPR